jgi:ATP-dependent Clp protease ATP-binding subunit ClpC
VSPSLEVNVEKNLTRQRALKKLLLKQKYFKVPRLVPAHLLLCILRNENDPTTKLLNKLKLITI